MGGCGGKKQRMKVKAGATIGGQFNSIGTREEQQHNAALVVRLLGEIGPDGERMADSNDRLFLQDVRIKINQAGSNAQFGWRQVQRMVEAHASITAKREILNAKRNGTGSPRTSPAIY